jgi:biotin carboxyl carrier protein
MPGTVVEVVVTEGDDVEPGTLLMTIESMKLQTAITAPHAARVAEVCVDTGSTFDQGDTLIRLEVDDPDEEDEEDDTPEEGSK